MEPNSTFETGNMSPSSPSDQASISQTITALGHEIAVMFEREAKLLRTELSEKFTLLKTNGSSLVAAVFLVFFGIQGVLAAAVIGLATVMEWWLAAFLVGALLLIAGAVHNIHRSRPAALESRRNWFLTGSL